MSIERRSDSHSIRPPATGDLGSPAPDHALVPALGDPASVALLDPSLGLALGDPASVALLGPSLGLALGDPASVALLGSSLGLAFGDQASVALLDPSLGLAFGDPAGNGPDADPGAASSALIATDNEGTQLGAAWLASLSKPNTVSSVPQLAAVDSTSFVGAAGGTSGGNDILAAASPAVPGGGLSGDLAADGGSASVDLFSKSATAGAGGGHHGGGAPPPYSVTAHNMNFVINWDSSVGSAPSGFVPGVESAVGYFLANLPGPSTLTTFTLKVGWGEVNGSRLGFGALGESETNINLVGFGTLQTALLKNLPAGDGPQSDPIPAATTHYYWAPSAEEKALGIIGNNTGLDGAVGFSSSAKWSFNSPTTPTGQYDFVSVAEHEISETMGRIGLGGATVSDSGVNYANSYSPFDLFRFSDVSMSSPAGGSSAYFSYNNGVDSGATNLALNARTFFNTIAGGDYSDWASSAGNDAYNAFSGTGPLATSNVDKLVMQALGYGTIS